MYFTLLPGLLFLTALAQKADTLPKASRSLEGTTTTFPENCIAKGVRVTVGVLESCHAADDDESYTVADLKKARKGDHVWWDCPGGITFTVQGVTYTASEVVYSSGVFWFRSGDKVVRCAKYEFGKWEPFEAWYRQSLP